jgi:phage recombination protein Bet
MENEAMSAVVPLKPNVDWTPAQLKLAKHTVAKDSNDDEFNLFIHTCRATGLDPLRKQAYLWIFNKDKPKYRRMVIVTSIGGYRSIAARTGNYRPNNAAPIFEYSTAEKDAAFNPKGLVKATETVWQYAHGEWFQVVAEARWDAYAPIIEEPENGWRYENTGEQWPDGKPKQRKVPQGKMLRRLDPDKTRWRVDPEGMLAKCAEALALRKAWPDDFAGVNSEDEMDSAHSSDKFLDLTATEIVNQAETDQKLDLMGGKNALTVDWGGGNPLERVPEGQFIDKALKWIAQPHVTREDAEHWWKRNEVTRAEYKARHGGEYLDFQRAWEQRLGKLPRDCSQEPVESAQDEKEQAVIERLKERIGQCASVADLEKLEKDAASTIDKLSLPRHAEALKLIANAKGTS